MKRINLMIILTSLMFLGGCAGRAIDYKFLVKQGAETATVIALNEAEATVTEAEKVKSIAITVQDILKDGGEIDSGALKALIIQQLNNLIPQEDRAVYMALLHAITNLVLENLEGRQFATSDEAVVEIIILANAAAQGVESGADIYITAKGEALTIESVKIKKE